MRGKRYWWKGRSSSTEIYYPEEEGGDLVELAWIPLEERDNGEHLWLPANPRRKKLSWNMRHMSWNWKRKSWENGNNTERNEEEHVGEDEIHGKASDWHYCVDVEGDWRDMEDKDDMWEGECENAEDNHTPTDGENCNENKDDEEGIKNGKVRSKTMKRMIKVRDKVQKAVVAVLVFIIIYF